MRTKVVYLFDQLLFSAFSFVLFLVVDKQFDLADVAQYSVMVSGCAFLLNFGFALMVERRLGGEDKRLTFYDFIVLITLVGVMDALISSVLWHDYKHSVLLGLTMFASSMLWLSRRITLLDEGLIKFSVMLTVLSGAGSVCAAYVVQRFSWFLVTYSLICAVAVTILVALSIRSAGKGVRHSFGVLLAEPGHLLKSVMLVPLLWFPSNGIYLVLTYLGSTHVLVEMRKLLMLLSPVQQLSSAMINYIFSRNRNYASSRFEYLVLPLSIAVLATPVCAVIYKVLLDGPVVGLDLWFAFALIVGCMLAISIMQSVLRVGGKQSAVIVSFSIAVIVKLMCLVLFYYFGGGISLTAGFISMAVAYSASAVSLGFFFAPWHNKSERVEL
ncbi:MULTISPECIES: hypothetical protein [unclassified Pseudomonas]|uniref:hypothetical protein n=1 Tax=unclassified Pseudomonas TaxID=196821 RepID=UPI0021BAD95A|nr:MULTISPECIES: hypothetical protein [unclassified Pseudomonas]MCT8166640.1 hypothetical protein [Pseudomonas sp. HD6422]MCT8185536.1 hypothetical protein [Pseudomonas sp. HD6421]